MVSGLVLNYVNRRHHVSVRSIEFPEQISYSWVEKPAPVRPAIVKPDFPSEISFRACRSGHSFCWALIDLISLLASAFETLLSI